MTVDVNSDEYAEDWWKCPKCGGQTELNDHPEPPEPDRYCTECDWSVSIARPESGV